MEIWDAHVHLGKPHTDEIWGKDQSSFSIVDDMKLLKDMETNCINRAIIFPTQSVGMDYVDSNSNIANWTKKHPDKFFGFARVDPRLGSRAIEEIKRASKIGLMGLKLHPEIECFRPDHSSYDDLYKTLIDKNFILSIHSSSHESSSSPYVIEKIALKFPKLKIILGHLSSDALSVMERTKNIWADTSLTGHKTIKMTFEMGLEDRIVFGTDYPYADGPEFEIWKIKKAIPKEIDQEKIFYKNLKNLLKV